MGFFKRLFGKKDIKSESGDIFSSPDLLFYILLEETVFGPFSLSEIKEYPLKPKNEVATDIIDKLEQRI